MNPVEILAKYWGHSAFRPLQEEIIQSVISSHDTLAILPTGGGKSICFQIPGIYLQGLTVVISPLIALMNDQVENLKRRNISAIALHSGLTKREIELEFGNIKNGKYKFLYVSPERIQTEQFQDLVAVCNIKLIAVDEAHCISQWGYDFRPEYLAISNLRKMLPNVPCIALTASATPKVVEDIKTYLTFDEHSHSFSQTITRPNLSYVVLNDENKNERLIKIVNTVKGSGIVYCKNRKTTVSVSQLLSQHKVVADYYHAGLDLEDRNKKQDAWQKGYTRIMVCTNAFGMGIDKGNVRFVIHYDMPESLEAYYQEAGRAGRDGNESWCVMLSCKPDIVQARKLLESKFLDKKTVQAVFNAICNHLQLPYQSGKDTSFELDEVSLSAKYGFSLPVLHTALGMLQKEGLIKRSEAFINPSKLIILTDNISLYKFYLAHPHYELLIKTLLRMYGGLFDYYTTIVEAEVAKNIKIPYNQVKAGLAKLHQLRIMDYIPQNQKPLITFLTERPNQIPFNTLLWKDLKDRAFERLNETINYTQINLCRQKSLALYFGEQDAKICGKCDICRAKKQHLGETLKKLSNLLSEEFSANFVSLNEITDRIGKSETVMEAFRFLMDNGKLIKNEEGKLKWAQELKK